MKIVFFGDSVTDGVFELLNKEGGFECVYDRQHVYHKILTDRLKTEYPSIGFETVNAGISGNSSENGLQRIDEVLKENADIVVVCFGLNDVCSRDIGDYADNMNAIFKAIKDSGSEVIFLTPNMLNTYVAEGTLPILYGLATECAKRQNNGSFDEYLERAKGCARQNGVYIADAYAEWKKLAYYGVDTTKLLVNKINHPTREMHRLFADVLFKTFIDNKLIK